MRIIDLRTDPHAPIPRPATGDEAGSAALKAVRGVIADVRRRGDAALRELTERYDGARLDTVRVPERDIKAVIISAGVSSPAITAATFSTIGISTWCLAASSVIDE